MACARISSFLSYLKYRLRESNTTDVYVYGKGAWARIIIDYLSSDNFCVLGLIDDGYGQTFKNDFGLPVLSSKSLLDSSQHIVIASEIYQEVIFNRLITNGYSPSQLFRIFESPDLNCLRAIKA